MKVLVIGRAGSGKTTVALELQRRGLVAFDADEVPKLSAWIDLATGHPTRVNKNGIIDYTRVDWLWNEHVLESLLAAHRDLFLCGGAGNDLALGSYFDKVVVLDVSPTVQAERLRTRTNNDYGKNPAMIPKIIAQQADLLTRAIARGAIRIDVNHPIEIIVNQIVEQTQCEEHS